MKLDLLFVQVCDQILFAFELHCHLLGCNVLDGSLLGLFYGVAFHSLNIRNYSLTCRRDYVIQLKVDQSGESIREFVSLERLFGQKSGAFNLR